MPVSMVNKSVKDLSHCIYWLLATYDVFNVFIVTSFLNCQHTSIICRCIWYRNDISYCVICISFEHSPCTSLTTRQCSLIGYQISHTSILFCCLLTCNNLCHLDVVYITNCVFNILFYHTVHIMIKYQLMLCTFK